MFQQFVGIMESKTWIWNRKSTGKNIEKGKTLELEKSVENLNGQLSSVRGESNAKDDLLAKQAKVAEEAISGWEKAEARALALQKQLDDALLKKKMTEERLVEQDTELQEFRQQLCVVKEDQQLIVNNASMKISRELEKTRMVEQRLVGTNKKLAELVTENGNLKRILEAKEQLLAEMNEAKSNLEKNFTDVVSRLDASEKLNVTLNYEVCVLQKELEIRNEERDFNRRSTDAAHRQHLESIKKIAKLEAECQRLRVMVRKRLPGPAALAKMRNEVEVLGYDELSKDASSVVKKLHAIDNENKVLKETLTKKTNELQASRIMFARTASKLSQVETQLEDFSRGKTSYELAKSSPMSYNLPCSSISEHGGNEDNLSSAESWASALISELEHFKSGKPTATSCKSVAISDLSLMDDFVEMEKLAIITVDKHFDSSRSVIGDNNLCVATKESEAECRDLVPLMEVPHYKYSSLENYPIWLQDILRVIVQKHHIMQKSFHAILEDVQSALGNWDSSIVAKSYSEKVIKTKNTLSDSVDGAITTDSPNRKRSSRFCESDLEKSVHKLVELVEGIIQKSNESKTGQGISSGDDDGPSLHDNSASENGYTARTFLWEISNLTSILQNFIAACNDLLTGKIDLQKLTEEISSTLDLIISHSFSIQDVTDTKVTIRKHMAVDESYREHGLKSVSVSNGLHILFRVENLESKLKDENDPLKSEILSIKSERKDLEDILKTFSAQNEALKAQLQESEAKVSNLQKEIGILKKTREQIEEQIENKKSINEDLAAKLAFVEDELNEALQKFASLEVQLAQRNNCCEELEATCLELQLELERALSDETPKHIMRPEDKQIQMECGIIAATEKLTACQETILNLGKQLKALASADDGPLFEKAISTTVKSNHHRLQLLDHMREEENPSTKPPHPLIPASENTNLSHKNSLRSIVEMSPENNASDKDQGEVNEGMLMIMAKKQDGGASLLRKLLLQRRRKSSTRLELPMGAQ
ncbi:filament-like plant protein 7 isoform X1 [Zingiber officinale]|nr:filament-like plant protein 7 isoform X1 [Zingiber officinale]XP_042417751.1 filament-like plant protein 7 isoform X1 [Zingiber officinale]